MRSIASYLPAVLLLAAGLNCGDDQQGPSADGPPFFTATIDGVVWPPDDFVALLTQDIRSTQTGVRLEARRNLDDGGSETLFISLFTPDPFSLTSYRLTTGGAGEAAGFFQQVPNPPDPEVIFSTGEEHTGTLRITGANTTDSVVSGLFAFEAEDGLTGEVRQFRGEFRVRYEVD